MLILRRGGPLICATIVAVAALSSGPVARSSQSDPNPAVQVRELSAEEQRWLDRRVPQDERETLDAARGYAPGVPAAGAFWVGGEAPQTFESLRGKVVVVQSWTHANEPGRSALTRTLEILKTIDDPDVKVVALHTPDGAAAAKSYIEKRSLGAPVLVDPDGAFCDALGVYKRPVTLILDRSGAVRYTGVSLGGLRPALQALLLEAPPAADAPLPPALPARAEGGESQQEAAPAAKSAFPPIAGQVSANDLRGKKGPPIKVGQWLTSEPSTEGKVVMVEFWATWCGPCLRSIPHLNKLHDRHREKMVIIGVSDEDAATVRAFMQKTRFNYTVAIDQRRTIINAVKPRGIPHTIIMSPDGIVRWQGNPLSLEDRTVEQIINASNVGAGSGAKRWKT